jgi:indolepyruvate ferredoxin oxidoreductase
MKSITQPTVSAAAHHARGSSLHSISLEDRYTVERGQLMLTGIQAIVRMLLEQRRLDVARGLNTRVFVSGYPGSPLGGLDAEIDRNAKHLVPVGVVHQAGVNEELAATAVAGTQLLGELPGRRHDGVVGIWYGKHPGLDRAADAIRHGNISGTSYRGGAVALIGDDPTCKSSTLPSSTEAMCRSLLMPFLAPSTVAEVIELGLHAVALSRASGAWVGVKIVSDVADSSSNVELGQALHVPLPPQASRGKPPVLLAPTSVQAEYDLMTTRLERARQYSLENNLNRITFEPSDPVLGLVAAGGCFASLQRALGRLGLGESELEQLGVRVVQLRMPWPLSEEEAVALTDGLHQVLVVEDKLPFVESLLKELLYGRVGAPKILGKRDASSEALLSEYGAVDVDQIVEALGRVLDPDRTPASVRDRLVVSKPWLYHRPALELVPSRTPFFCSGCPHNTSTKAAPDQIVGAGIGCHALIAFDPAAMRGNVVGAPQMGGEGAHWLGLAPYTDDVHFVQNIGDGTFHHSGSLAIRAAVAAGLRMTYKILYNDAVAMTGGQTPQGRLDVPALTKWLVLEGVREVVVVTAEPRAYRRKKLDARASVRSRDDLEKVEAALATIPGVTVIIYDDRCATEKRRMRKRGLLPQVEERVWINERVCEGCGDCGEKSTCLSVVPVDTEFGRKTHIHQASCNSDMSCLKGDCPSFVMVEPVKRKRKATPPKLPVELDDPTLRVSSDELLVRMPGVGGTGVVTLSQILQMAAKIDGKWAAGLDQTGLAQKGGAVISDVRFSNAPITAAVRASSGTIDVLLGFDALGSASPATLQACDPDRTVAVVNTGVVATAAMVVDVGVGPGSAETARAAIDQATQSPQNLYLDALKLSEVLFGDHMPTNVLMLGAAFQLGYIPLTKESIRAAIELNGSAVQVNLAAFEWGRVAVTAPELVQGILASDSTPMIEVDSKARDLLHGAGAPSELLDVLLTRVSDLVGYQSLAYAETYLAAVLEIAEAERRAIPNGGHELALSYARGLHKLMAYKDEYEVARLHRLPSEQRRIVDQFGPGARSYVLLHPPVLRALGLRRKIRFGRWFGPALTLLSSCRRVRGTWADPFGYARVRRVERELIQEYRYLVQQAVHSLHERNLHDIVAIAELADVVRGYEDIKLRNVEEFRRRSAGLLAALNENP